MRRENRKITPTDICSPGFKKKEEPNKLDICLSVFKKQTDGGYKSQCPKETKFSLKDGALNEMIDTSDYRICDYFTSKNDNLLAKGSEGFNWFFNEFGMSHNDLAIYLIQGGNIDDLISSLRHFKNLCKEIVEILYNNHYHFELLEAYDSFDEEAKCMIKEIIDTDVFNNYFANKSKIDC